MDHRKNHYFLLLITIFLLIASISIGLLTSIENGLISLNFVFILILLMCLCSSGNSFKSREKIIKTNDPKYLDVLVDLGVGIIYIIFGVIFFSISYYSIIMISQYSRLFGLSIN